VTNGNSNLDAITTLRSAPVARVLLAPPARALRRNRIVESITSNCVMSGVASGVMCGGTKDVPEEASAPWV